MPEEERDAALLYISHSDATERQARILRVQQSLVPGFVEPTVAKPIISHDLNKGKGHVFSFHENDKTPKRNSAGIDGFAVSEPVTLKAKPSLNRDYFDQEASSASSPSCPTVFHMGSSSGMLSSGTKTDGKKSRRRPQKWKRLNQTQKPFVSSQIPDVTDTALAGFGSGISPMTGNNLTKRKASPTVEEQSSKSSKTTQPMLVSDLKPLPSQRALSAGTVEELEAPRQFNTSGSYVKISFRIFYF